jgi:hypothetical protein
MEVELESEVKKVRHTTSEISGIAVLLWLSNFCWECSESFTFTVGENSSFRRLLLHGIRLKTKKVVTMIIHIIS